MNTFKQHGIGIGIQTHAYIRIHPYCVLRSELSVCDNVIFRGCRIFIPKATRSVMLQWIYVSRSGAESWQRKAKLL